MVRTLSQFDYKAAWVLPYIKHGGARYFLLGRESAGSDAGTWDAFGGKRDRGEKHPVVTAARESYEESMGLLYKDIRTARNYINLS